MSLGLTLIVSATFGGYGCSPRNLQPGDQVYGLLVVSHLEIILDIWELQALSDVTGLRIEIDSLQLLNILLVLLCLLSLEARFTADAAVEDFGEDASLAAVECFHASLDALFSIRVAFLRRNGNAIGGALIDRVVLLDVFDNCPEIEGPIGRWTGSEIRR